MTLRRAIHAELRQIRTTRAVLVLLAVTCALAALSAYVLTTFLASTPTLAMDSDRGLRFVLGRYASTGTDTIMICVGVLLTAGEFRHRTITTLLLAVPHRGRALLAKLVAAATTGAVFAVAATTVAVTVVTIQAARAGTPVSPLRAELWHIAAGTIIMLTCYALIGAGLGALIRNQVIAIGVTIGAAEVGDYLWRGLAASNSVLRELAHWLPSNAASALTRTVGMGPGGPGTGGDAAPMWQGALVLLGYTIVIAALAAYTLHTRDITDNDG